MKMDWGILLGSMITQDLTMDQHKQQSRLIHSLVRIACRASSVYIAEHFTDRQGCIRLFQHLAGLKEFQLIWHLVSKAFGMVSRKEGWTNPEESNEKKNIKITDA